MTGRLWTYSQVFRFCDLRAQHPARSCAGCALIPQAYKQSPLRVCGFESHSTSVDGGMVDAAVSNRPLGKLVRPALVHSSLALTRQDVGWVCPHPSSVQTVTRKGLSVRFRLCSTTIGVDDGMVKRAVAQTPLGKLVYPALSWLYESLRIFGCACPTAKAYTLYGSNCGPVG
jgi:hypothetical protein